MTESDATPFRTRGPAVDPMLRPRKQRRAARVLLRAPGSVLLFHDSDPGLPGAHWWNTPGGGVDQGESDLAAAVREIGEETGLRVDPADVRGPVAARVVQHGYSDQITVQHEVFFVVRVKAEFEISTAGHTEGEQRTLTGYRWWPEAEISATSEIIWPANLPRLLALSDAEQSALVDLGDVEESTVPIASSGDLQTH